MVWNHSVTFAQDFVPEWQAIENAADLAFEFGNLECTLAEPASVFKYAKTTKSVRFSSTAEVLVGLDTSIRMYNTTVPIEAFLNWQDKPWSLHCVDFGCQLSANPGFQATHPMNHCIRDV